MKKALKIILSTVSGLIIFIILLPILLSIVLQISFVQNYVVSKVSEKLSTVASTKITIGHVALDFFTSARLSDVYVEDWRGDTMIYAKDIRVKINGINFITGKISLGSTTLDNGKVYLYKDSVGVMNITQVFDNFKPKVPPENPPNFRLTATELNLLHTRFRLDDHTAPPDRPSAINYKRMEMDDINFQARNISVFNHNIWLKIEHIDMRERSGFRLNHLSSERCGVDSSGMYYADVVFEAGSSTMRLDSLNFLTTNHSWWDWNDFEHKMILSAIVDESDVSTETLSYFTGFKLANNQIISIERARLLGPVPSMKGRVERVTMSDNALWGDFSIVGLPDIDSTIFVVDLSRVESSLGGVSRLLWAVSGDSLDVSSAAIVRELGALSLKAHFEGSVQKFAAMAELHSGAGRVVAQASMRPTSAGRYLSGVISTSDFDAGRALGVEKLGGVTLGGSFDLNLVPSRPIVLGAKVDVAKVHYGAYDFADIKVDGSLAAKKFSGSVSSGDPNFNFEAEGLFDFTKAVPNYHLSVDLKHADLWTIGLNKRDSVSMLSAVFTASGSGRELDDFNGEGRIDKIFYINHLDTIQTSDIFIASVASAKYKELTVNSDFVDIKLRGRNSFSEIWRYFSQSLQRFFPSFPEATSIVGQKSWAAAGSKKIERKTTFPFSDGYYQLNVDVKQANNVAGIFVPSLEIASGSSVNFFFNPYLDQFTLRVKSEYVWSDEFTVEDLSVDSRNHNDSLSLFATADYFSVGGFEMPNLSIIGGIRNNTISLAGQFVDAKTHNSALLNTTTTFVRNEQSLPQMLIELHPTAVVLNGKQWNIAPSTIVLDTTGITVRDVAVYSGAERIAIGGKIGATTKDTLSVALNRADISASTMLVSDLGYRIAGNANGSIKLVSALNDLQLFAAIDFAELKLNDYSLGSPTLRSTIDPSGRGVNFAVGNNLLDAPIVGHYNIAKSSYWVDIRFPSFDMVLIEPMLKGILTDTRGSADVRLRLEGLGDKARLGGEVLVKEYSVMVDYTKARYTLKNALVNVKNSSFYLPSTPIVDGLNGHGELTAKLTTNYFKDLRFSIAANFVDLLALNTTAEDNSSFYGKAYGTGRINIDGTESRTNIVISAQSALNSDFTLPLSDVATIERAGFIRFVDPKAQAVSEQDVVVRRRPGRQNLARRKAQNELDIRLNMHILPNALAQIELDAKVGDIIRGRGEGRLAMHINPSLDIFTMSGPVQITQGTYLFTLQTIFNKRFTINAGSEMLWTGAPTNPDVNLTALYKVKTSLEPLVGVLSGQASQANIDCGINLTGKLLTPNIRFSITAPAADPETQNLIRNSINTEEALSMQFLSLMLANSFMPDMGTAAIGTMGSSMVGITGLEFLSNQLSNLISSDKVNIRFGYRPQSVASSDEFYAGVRGDFIADVLSFEVDGNYNTGNNPSYNQISPFTVDAYLTWNINKLGTLKLKGFTRTIDRFDETQGMQESGVGVYFRQNFSDLADLKERLSKSYGKKARARADSLQRIERAERDSLRMLKKTKNNSR